MQVFTDCAIVRGDQEGENDEDGAPFLLIIDSLHAWAQGAAANDAI